MSAFVLSVMMAAMTVSAGPEIQTPLLRVADMNIGESQAVELCDGKQATLKLIGMTERRDPVRDAVREVKVDVEVNGQPTTLFCSMYHLPTPVAGVRIDCSITRHFLTNSTGNAWALAKDARFRLWPAGSPLLRPGTFVYPVQQRWFAGQTQMANEPVFVDGGERYQSRKIYYHSGLDFGGAEGMVNVVAATDGLVVSAGGKTMPEHAHKPVKPRYDVIYLLDGRGWYYRYSHLASIAPRVKIGQRVKMGQKIGTIGKEGGSGGWTHLHFEIDSLQPSGQYGVQAAYGFAWEAYQSQYSPKLIAVARPHHCCWSGDTVELDASLSWTAADAIKSYDWTFTDGTTAQGPKVSRRYDRPGTYSEVLKVTDAAGWVSYDFAIVQVIDKENPERYTPSIQPAFAPTQKARPGHPVTFKVRTFNSSRGGEVWDFGDGSEKVTVRSDANADQHAVDGFAVTHHVYARPGNYIARVEHVDEFGVPAIGHLWIRVR